MSRTRKVLAGVFASLALLATAAPVMAAQPPGQLGYEGNSGNQGGPSHHP